MAHFAGLQTIKGTKNVLDQGESLSRKSQFTGKNVRYPVASSESVVFLFKVSDCVTNSKITLAKDHSY